MRKQLLGVFLPLLVVVLVAAAETQNTGTEATRHAAVQKVNVVRGDDGIRVEITARGQVAPKLSTLDRPDRVVLDLPNTVVGTSQNRISVDSDGVKGVRVGMDGQTPPTTRVVVDLQQACPYELLPSSDNKIVLQLHPAATTARAATRPAHLAASKSAAAVTPAPARNETAASKPAPVVTAPASETKPAQSAASATDYVFVEPSYKPKAVAEENKPAVTGPPARVVEAAAKFVDRPEGNLLPTPSASMHPQETTAAPGGAAPCSSEPRSSDSQAGRAP